MIRGFRDFPVRRIAFAVSLGLNVFFAALVGAHLIHRGGRDASGPHAGGPLDRLIAALPPGDAQRFRTVLDVERPNYGPARDQVTANHRLVAEAIARAPYDERAVAAALRAWQASWQQFSSRFDGVFLDGVAAISDEGRARLAKAALAEDERRQRTEQSSAR